MRIFHRQAYLVLISTLAIFNGNAQSIEKIKYGDFSSWVTRHLHESAVIGGNDKTVYEIEISNKPLMATSLTSLPVGRPGERAMFMLKSQG